MKWCLSIKIRIVCSVVLLILTLSLLAGCWDSRELNDLALVVGAALDKSKEDQIMLTVQILTPRSAGSSQQGGGGSSTQPQFVIKSATGQNMADAMLNLQQKVSRQIFWGHCEIFIFGESLSKHGNLKDQIDYLNRHPEPRERANLFVSRGNAADILETNPTLESYTGNVLQKLNEIHFDEGLTMKDFEQNAILNAEGAILPFIDVPPATLKNEESIPSINGIAIFNKSKMIGNIDIDTSKGLLWIQNQIEQPTVTATIDKRKTISFKSIRESTKLTPSIHHSKWSITINVKSEGMVVQNASDIDVIYQSEAKKAEQALEKEIKRNIGKALQKVKNDLETDAFGFGEVFHHKYPDEWQKIKNNWNHFLPEVSVKVQVKVNIKEPGLTTTPLELLEKEKEVTD
ncbi:Ger(x)C family spore germination protein [Bacillus sp. V5-8f]|uniref:Ger(x)C family spore germination protein n=1 Tax=Bacillus sp. V5-8f TaxID=2053044 RepID=UPI000C78FFC3|nr:Ger(x)C family spore germination protein [Bacillus sp. V5-8f]PLT35413.1 Ger(x)C family spore germination protein [Bacillus sp. V5-8f]